jgi:hypothetical protein
MERSEVKSDGLARSLGFGMRLGGIGVLSRRKSQLCACASSRLVS